MTITLIVCISLIVSGSGEDRITLLGMLEDMAAAGETMTVISRATKS